VCVNLVGAGSAAAFPYSFLHFYLQSHRLIGIVFFAQQMLVAIAYLIRRPARLVTRPAWMTGSWHSPERLWASCSGQKAHIRPGGSGQVSFCS